MRSLLANAAKGLPSLLGVLGGILLYQAPACCIWLPVAAAVAAFIILRIGQMILRTRLLLGWMVIEVWIVAAVSVIAVTTYAILRLKEQRFPAFEGYQQKAVSDMVVGAVTTYLGLLWTKDIAEGGGFFSPGAQFRQALREVFGKEGMTPKRDTREWEAAFEERVRAGGPIGWGFVARYRRALILRQHPAPAPDAPRPPAPARP